MALIHGSIPPPQHSQLMPSHQPLPPPPVIPTAQLGMLLSKAKTLRARIAWLASTVRADPLANPQTGLGGSRTAMYSWENTLDNYNQVLQQIQELTDLIAKPVAAKPGFENPPNPFDGGYVHASRGLTSAELHSLYNTTTMMNKPGIPWLVDYRLESGQPLPEHVPMPPGREVMPMDQLDPDLVGMPLDDELAMKEGDAMEEVYMDLEDKLGRRRQRLESAMDLVTSLVQDVQFSFRWDKRLEEGEEGGEEEDEGEEEEEQGGVEDEDEAMDEIKPAPPSTTTSAADPSTSIATSSTSSAQPAPPPEQSGHARTASEVIDLEDSPPKQDVVDLDLDSDEDMEEV